MKKIITLLSLCIVAVLQAQDIKLTTKDNDLKLTSLPYYNFGKGVGLTSSDSLFQFNVRFRMQNRLSYVDNEGVDPFYEAQVRRLRLRFDGYVGNPKILYVLQLSFGVGDVGAVKPNENLNVVRDAILYYKPSQHWQIGFGLSKLPGTRQAVNSSGAIQLTDRSINNTRFNIDRDFGLHLANINEFADKFSYNFKGAVTLGEGRNWTSTNKDNNGLSLTGKVELLPFGKFKKDGHYFEGDILREEKPKLMVSGVYNFNNKARKSQGQTGDILFENKDMSSVLLDAILKYRGWAFMTTYMQRSSHNPITVNPLDATQTKAVFTGNGQDFQLSYVFKSKYELIGRFSQQNVNKDIKAYAPDTNQYSFGVNKYIWEHALKLQGEFTYENQFYDAAPTKNNWYVRFQIEIGI
ncbi:phosphate-selective porin O and P [Flavobacterium cauense R2A-7]|uniref:Phosphate-selective porin O/P n=1 Tax=Flavobacterium cauense R2A-7 TaxID=1341154 RepID=V6S4F2_9FLAO|nr:porin [Flavobacterium cauense]ESU21294.1 phosphate-selective porin O and P [Flavobacterium cauense R2A-7]KGO80057.1 porin [Flavobacterium cauense R2A-7]TWI08996.1 phosphate-selective porin O/P [Flavobacterium cauense R2A-7]